MFYMPFDHAFRRFHRRQLKVAMRRDHIGPEVITEVNQEYTPNLLNVFVHPSAMSELARGTACHTATYAAARSGVSMASTSAASGRDVPFFHRETVACDTPK